MAGTQEPGLGLAASLPALFAGSDVSFAHSLGRNKGSMISCWVVPVAARKGH